MTSSYVSWSRVLLHSDPLMTRHENGTFCRRRIPSRALGEQAGAKARRMSKIASGQVSGVSTPRSDRTWGAASSVSSASRAFTASFSRLVESSLSRRFPRYFANEGDVCGLTIGTLKEVEVRAPDWMLIHPLSKKIFVTISPLSRFASTAWWHSRHCALRRPDRAGARRGGVDAR